MITWFFAPLRETRTNEITPWRKEKVTEVTEKALIRRGAKEWKTR